MYTLDPYTHHMAPVPDQTYQTFRLHEGESSDGVGEAAEPSDGVHAHANAH